LAFSKAGYRFESDKITQQRHNEYLYQVFSIMDTVQASMSTRFGQTTGILTILLGALALLGWAFDILVFKHILPGLVAMKANTALGFVLAGYSLSVIQDEDSERRPFQAFGGVASLLTLMLGIATLSQDLFAWDLRIDQMLFSEPAGALFTAHPGRMSPLTAAGFILIGGATLLLHFCPQRHVLAQSLALLGLGLALFAVGCYLFGILLFEGKVFPKLLQMYTPMAIQTALGFLLLSIGILAATSANGILLRWRSILPGLGIGVAIALLLFSGAATILNWQRMAAMSPTAVLSPPMPGRAVAVEDRPFLGGLEENTAIQVSAIAAFGITLIFSAAVIIIVFAALRFQLSERQRIAKKLSESNLQLRRFKSVIDSMPAYVYIKDNKSRYLYANQLALSLFQRSDEDVGGCDDTQFFSAETAERLRTIDARVLQSGETTEEEVESVVNGSRRVYWDVKRPIYNEHGEIDGLIGLSTDISERKTAEEAMRLAELVYQNSSEGMAVTDAKGVIISVNPAFTLITGYEPAEAIGKNRRILNFGRQGRDFYQALWRALNTEGYWQGEICNRRKNGEYYTEWLSINSIFNEDGSVYRRVALFTDITQKKELEQKIWQQANFDVLTGLPNRPMFYDRLGHEMLKALRNGASIALLLLDLDRFKEINDTLGHHYGDKLLKETAQRLNYCIRESDTIARLGGDEFTIILNDLGDSQYAERVAQEILRQLAVSFKLNDDSTFISASIGIALFPEDANEIDQLLANADQAMYAAKAQGRNRYCYFAPAMQEAMLRRVHLIEDLRKAVHGRQFTVYYQPIVSLKTGALVKAEALLRWVHPERGLISPADFIPLAEETGLIIDIGDWVFHEAVSQLVRWQPLYGSSFQISINKSPVQFCNESHCLDQWPSYLHRQGLSGNSIIVEITEGLLMDVQGAVFDILLEFKKSGIQVAIDDFGVGYSSLAYLKKYDIDYLKIDKSFTQQLTQDSDSLALCEAIVMMAHKLGLRVIAEGVETIEQRDLLARIDCDHGQGYLFSKPLTPEEFEVNWKPICPD
jgi:diguanylate cyclase (GGDEF)-like protein/PAS domain S-box-containing protein